MESQCLVYIVGQLESIFKDGKELSDPAVQMLVRVCGQQCVRSLSLLICMSKLFSHVIFHLKKRHEQTLDIMPVL